MKRTVKFVRDAYEELSIDKDIRMEKWSYNKPKYLIENKIIKIRFSMLIHN